MRYCQCSILYGPHGLYLVLGALKKLWAIFSVQRWRGILSEMNHVSQRRGFCI